MDCTAEQQLVGRETGAVAFVNGVMTRRNTPLPASAPRGEGHEARQGEVADADGLAAALSDYEGLVWLGPTRAQVNLAREWEDGIVGA